MAFKRIVEERVRKGPILRRLREQFFRASTKILDALDFESSLKNDIRDAKSSVIIISPFLSEKKVSKFLTLREIKEAIGKGVKFIVITKPPEEVRDSETHEHSIQMLKEKMKVLKQPKLHFKSVIIDDSIIYIGSINPLSIVTVNYVPPDYMVRFESEALVDEIIENVIGKEKYENWRS